MSWPARLVWVAAVVLASSAAAEGLSLQSRVKAASVNLARGAEDCTSDCQFQALVLVASTAAEPGRSCMQDVLVESFRVAPSEQPRPGAVAIVDLSDAETGGRTTALAVMLLPEGRSPSVVEPSLCLPAALPNPDGGAALELSLSNAPADRDRLMASGMIGGLGGVRRMPLSGWQLGWVRAFITSSPTGAELLVDGKQVGLRTDRRIQLSRESLRRLRVRSAAGEIPIGDCESRVPSMAGVDVEFACRVQAAARPGKAP
jgi:hypothetical protein